ncbi:Arc family DNA-binding protein [Xanthomonas graminis]|uniref:Arc family DNA-binding protein n=1 Tax=Xanthomonas graminis TaxID=3390026 RepID=UPI0009B95602|nr:Arc family DNA-binding protein [Xanthomonas translucens]UKE66266.1 Arc family DNA-binding protein [Xanthomonas translucens pv. phlei]
MSSESPHFKIRLPAELKARLENSAKEQGRSLTADIVWRLEQSFELSPSLSEDLRRRVAEAASASGRSFDAELVFWLESYMARRAKEEKSIQEFNAVLEDLTRSFEEMGKGNYPASRRRSGMFPGAGKTGAAKSKGKAPKDQS